MSERLESLVTFEELEKHFNHYEIAYLAFHKAIEIIRTGVYLNNLAMHKKYKPKVAVIALRQLVSDPVMALEFSKELARNMVVDQSAENLKDDYNVDAGHMSPNG